MGKQWKHLAGCIHELGMQLFHTSLYRAEVYSSFHPSRSLKGTLPNTLEMLGMMAHSSQCQMRLILLFRFRKLSYFSIIKPFLVPLKNTMMLGLPCPAILPLDRSRSHQHDAPALFLRSLGYGFYILPSGRKSNARK